VAAGLIALVTVTGLAVAAPTLARSVIRPLEELAARTEESVAALPMRLRWIEEGRTVVDAGQQTSPATGDDEVGRVSRRIDELVTTTVEMATAQARRRASLKEALCTVAQRESSLVQRQLALLDEFERYEEDPVVLSRLFRLDHLATQLRRSCDSLLVIAGARTTRRSAPPMGLVDVLRSAASQVEQYARVDIVASCEPFVQGRMAGDLIHLFAEVLDNATTYSQPSTRVEVRVATDGACVVVRVRDHGIGFDGAALEKARARIAGPDDAMIDLGKLGLLVVGRLGERTGARTTIERPSVGEGTVVTTLLPPEVLDHAHTGTLSLRDVAGPWHQFDESAARPGVVTLYGQRAVVPLGDDQDQNRTAVRRTDLTDGSTS
jgi:signal transduction histidine kinase